MTKNRLGIKGVSWSQHIIQTYSLTSKSLADHKGNTETRQQDLHGTIFDTTVSRHPRQDQQAVRGANRQKALSGTPLARANECDKYLLHSPACLPASFACHDCLLASAVCTQKSPSRGSGGICSFEAKGGIAVRLLDWFLRSFADWFNQYWLLCSFFFFLYWLISFFVHPYVNVMQVKKPSVLITSSPTVSWSPTVSVDSLLIWPELNCLTTDVLWRQLKPKWCFKCRRKLIAKKPPNMPGEGRHNNWLFCIKIPHVITRCRSFKFRRRRKSREFKSLCPCYYVLIFRCIT